MKNMLRVILLFITTLLAYCQSQINTHSTISFDEKFEEKMFTDPTIFKVDGFVDGDTFWVLNADSQRVKIRLIGIDAPENKNVFNKKKHPFGVHAKAYTDSILTKHSYLKLAFDVDSIDRYGRTLAYVYLNDGTFLNEDLVKNGYATVMTISPNVKHDKLFYEAQVFAREHKLGIWKD
jgi:micrococcal nuclease